VCFILILIYLLTAIGLTPGGPQNKIKYFFVEQFLFRYYKAGREYTAGYELTSYRSKYTLTSKEAVP